MQEGTQISQYILVRKLGEGGMGEVWLAQHRYLNTIVAIKSLLPEYAHNEGLQERFLSEAKRQSQLQHPNIVPVLDFFEIDGRSYFVMQYVEGQSLEDRLHESNPPLSLGEIHGISWDVLSALDHAHAHDIVHRDVKPANILIDHSGRALLMDFGIARALRDESRKTLTGISMGTPDYMSPEQVLGNSVDARTDIYSFGCVLYAMLCGQPPFGTGPTPVFIVQEQHVHGAPPPPVFRTAGVPPGVSAVVLQCLEKDPARRYQSCRDLMVALDAGLSEGLQVQESIAAPVLPDPVRPDPVRPLPVSPPKTPVSAGGGSAHPTTAGAADQAGAERTGPVPLSGTPTPGVSPLATVATASPANALVTPPPAVQPPAQRLTAATPVPPRSRGWIYAVAAVAAIALAGGAVAWWQFNPAHTRLQHLEAKSWALAGYDDPDFSDCMNVEPCLNAKSRAAQLIALTPADWHNLSYNSPLLNNCMNYQPCLSRLAHARELTAVANWKSADAHLLNDCMGYPACQSAKTPVHKPAAAVGGDENWPDCCATSSSPAACRAWKAKEQIPDCSSPIDNQ